MTWYSVPTWRTNQMAVESPTPMSQKVITGRWLLCTMWALVTLRQPLTAMAVLRSP